MSHLTLDNLTLTLLSDLYRIRFLLFLLTDFSFFSSVQTNFLNLGSLIFDCVCNVYSGVTMITNFYLLIFPFPVLPHSDPSEKDTTVRKVGGHFMPQIPISRSLQRSFIINAPQ